MIYQQRLKDGAARPSIHLDIVDLLDETFVSERSETSLQQRLRNVGLLANDGLPSTCTRERSNTES